MGEGALILAELTCPKLFYIINSLYGLTALMARELLVAKDR